MSDEDTMISTADRNLDELFEMVLSMLEDGQTVEAEPLAAECRCTSEEAERIIQLARTTLSQSGVRARTAPPLIKGYEVLSEIGRGGMSCVYLARQQSLGGRAVALKVLSESIGMSRSARRRFLDEARAIARFRHPHIVSIYEVIERPSLCAYTIEFVDGTTLAHVIARAGGERGSIEMAQLRSILASPNRELNNSTGSAYICQLGLAIARALETVHDSGLVHRDVKPSNVLIRSDGTPLLSDFGLVRDIESTVHTVDGTFVGTLAYASPEQLRGDHRAVDARSDIYSLGASLYHAIAGRRPIEVASPTAMLQAIETRGVPPLRRINRDIGRDFETVIATAIDPEPNARYQTATQLADDLERVLSFRSIRARPAGLVRRGRRFTKRHRRPLLAAIAGAIAMILLIVTAWTMLVVRPAAASAQLDDARLALLDPKQSMALTMHLIWNDSSAGPPFSAIDARRALDHYAACIRLDPLAAEPRHERAVVRAAMSLAGKQRIDRETDDTLRELPTTRAYAQDQSLPTDWIAASRDDLRCAGLLAYLVADIDGAIAAWSELERRDDTNSFVEAALGQVYLWRGEAGRAYPRLQRATEAFPNVGFLTVNLADAAIRCGDVDRAGRLLDRAAAMPGLDGTGGFDRVRADHLAAEGHADDARAIYRSMLGRNPIAALHLGRLCETEGDWMGAMHAYRVDAFIVEACAESFLRVVESRWADVQPFARCWLVWQIAAAHPAVRQVVLQVLRDVMRAEETLAQFGAHKQNPENSPLNAALKAPTSASEEERASVALLAERLEVEDMRLWNQIEEMGHPIRRAMIVALLLDASGSDIRRAWSRLKNVVPMLGAIGGLTFSAGGFTGPPIEFSETEFAPETYSVEIVIGGLGGVSTLTQVSEGGSTGPYLSVQHDLPPGETPGLCLGNYILSFVFPDSAVIDPAAVGGIASIDYTIQSLLIDATNSNLAQGQSLAIRQDGRIFTAGGIVTPDAEGWQVVLIEGLVEEDFSFIEDAPLCEPFSEFQPDFSASGSPIELGFSRSNSTSFGGNDVATQIIIGADTWSATVHTAGVVDPCPSDIDDDGTVGVNDLLVVLASWGSTEGDLNGDGTTDVTDLLLLLSAWGACEG